MRVANERSRSARRRPIRVGASIARCHIVSFAPLPMMMCPQADTNARKNRRDNNIRTYYVDSVAHISHMRNTCHSIGAGEESRIAGGRVAKPQDVAAFATTLGVEGAKRRVTVFIKS